MNKIQYKIQNNYPIKLQDLREHKQEVLKEVREQQDLLSGRFDKIVAPFTRAEGSNPIMNSFNIGMAAVDTIIMGVRAFRKIGRLFSKK